MIIACPRCETTFTLPDELYKAGKKARCSQCGLVFPMPDPSVAPARAAPAPGYGESAAPTERAGKALALASYKKPLLAGGAALLLLMLVYGAWLVCSSFFGSAGDEPVPDEPAFRQDEPRPVDSQAEYQRLINSISLDEIRQFVVDNMKLGRVMVIQGVAINIADSPKDYVAIEARLLDSAGRPLIQRRQLCGPSMTLFQLQNLDEREFQEVQNNRIAILTNNTNIPPDGKTPFVFVFPSPPDKVRSFEVRVIDARDSPPQ